VAAGQPGLTGGAQPLFYQIHVYNYFWKPNSTRNMLKQLQTMEFPLYFSFDLSCYLVI
jgi:hypothetical protein